MKKTVGPTEAVGVHSHQARANPYLGLVEVWKNPALCYSCRSMLHKNDDPPL